MLLTGQLRCLEHFWTCRWLKLSTQNFMWRKGTLQPITLRRNWSQHSASPRRLEETWDPPSEEVAMPDRHLSAITHPNMAQNKKNTCATWQLITFMKYDQTTELQYQKVDMRYFKRWLRLAHWINLWSQAFPFGHGWVGTCYSHRWMWRFLRLPGANITSKNGSFWLKDTHLGKFECLTNLRILRP